MARGSTRPAAPAVARTPRPAPRPTARTARQPQRHPPARAHQASRRRAAGAGAAAWARRARARHPDRAAPPSAAAPGPVSEISSQASVVLEGGKGHACASRSPCRPRIASSTRARRRWRSSRAAMSVSCLVGDEGGVAVAGLGSRGPRAGRRDGAARGGRSAACPRARSERSTWSVSSVTWAPSRTSPSPSICALPSRFGQLHDRLAHPLVDLVADREADAGVAAVLREGVGAPADVGAQRGSRDRGPPRAAARAPAAAPRSDRRRC